MLQADGPHIAGREGPHAAQPRGGAGGILEAPAFDATVNLRGDERACILGQGVGGAVSGVKRSVGRGRLADISSGRARVVSGEARVVRGKARVVSGKARVAGGRGWACVAGA